MLVDNYGQNLLGESTSPKEMQNVLFYLSRTDILKIEGNFLVFYNAIKVERIADVSRRYTKADYTKLEEFYENRKRQIHFVGEYAKLMKEDLLKAKEFERDYFNLESKEIEAKYYKGRQKELTLSITPKKYQELFSDLSQQQLKIIEDRDTQYIVVAAGPGSGKTRILTRKLASLSLLEDVKNDELLMLAFSRAAVNDFKTKMYEILKEQAKYIKIKTFHSYCFDLLGKVGNINESDVIEVATEKIKLGEVDEHMVNIKTLVIDEAQDMNNKDFGLIEALIEQNEDMRIIAVGDDDQCIYEVKKADPQLFSSFLKKDNSKKYELVDNYRSYANLVDFANQFIKNEKQRLKNQIINPVSKLFGKIQMTKVKSENIEGAAINAVLSEKNVGSTCIAAQTNEEVSMIAAMLMENGIDASKIQSLMNFKTKSYSLLEIRDFIKYITDSLEKNKANEISRELWEEAKEVNLKKYGKSQNLDVLKAFLKSFETDFPDEKYKDDVLEFAREMKLEELKDTEKNKIFVSTIHKIKGREFDNMYIVLGYKLKYKNSTERNRLIYVALTRARKNMHIFYKDDYFDHIKTLNLFKDVDNNDYKLPKEVIIKFDYSDVGLKYFDNSVMQYKISRLKSGDPLYFDDPKGKILFLSEDFQKGGRIFFSCKKDENIEIFRNKGYVMHKAKVQDIVYWKNPEKPDNPNEIKIILPEITLRLEDEQI